MTTYAERRENPSNCTHHMDVKSSSSALCMKTPTSPPPSSSDIPMEGGDVVSPLMQKNSPSAKSTWSTAADATDLFILLCSFLLTATSIVFVAFVFTLQAEQVNFPNDKTLSVLQRVISSLSVTITSAVIMVVGKRYVFFKLTRGGLRSRRVAVYSSPSIGALASYFVLDRIELPLLGLSAVWVLAVVTSLTVDNSWGWGPFSTSIDFAIPSGPLDPPAATPDLPWATIGAVELGYLQSSLCIGLEEENRLVNIINPDHPSSIIFYPPLLGLPPGNGFSFSTAMNGFDFSTENLSSIPPTAQSLNCYENNTFDLWFGGSNSQTLSIIAAQSSSNNSNVFRFNATAIVMGGTLSSTGNYVKFSRNGTSWPNVMSNDSQWAQDITSLVCNAPIPLVGSQCSGWSLIDIAGILNNKSSLDRDTFYSALSMALGAYSSAMYPYVGNNTLAPVTIYDVQFTSRYAIYILILHIITSLIVLVIVVRLRLASPLGPDFINSTRLLLGPLNKPELFNASLKTTLDALGDPYMVVSGDELLITRQKATREQNGGISLRNFKFDRVLTTT